MGMPARTFRGPEALAGFRASGGHQTNLKRGQVAAYDGLVKSPPHERQAIIDYYLSQSPKETTVLHAEKVASERIYGMKHDVWDVHASDGRWWVITNPTNFYPQEATPTPSMDHAFALHIGVTARLIAQERLGAPVDGMPRYFVAKTWRKYEQATEALNVADEAEDFQAVGMRLRECLTSFAQEASVHISESSDPPKRSDFKGWAVLLADAAAPGPHGSEIRSYLRVVSRETWDLVAWLTHAANATRAHAETALDATSHIVAVFSLALIRQRRGEPVRCPACGSYQVASVYDREKDETFQMCEACGWRDDLAD
jgi:hypothetical protein